MTDAAPAGPSDGATEAIVPGVARALSPLVRRVVAPNPGPMTGPGTNTYLVGIDEVAVIDPGPADDGHVDAILGAAGAAAIVWVLLTHTHPDHWPGAVALAERTGATVAGHRRVPKADGDVPIDVRIGDDERVTATEFQLRAVHTPGHAPNHLCFVLEEERAVFTGDHVLSGTTTVVNPSRGGDMAAYLASLERLRSLRRLTRIYPGHGAVITDPRATLDEYVAHRRARERQILAELDAGPRRISDLVAACYPDVPDALVEMAHRQVEAHLRMLRAEGRVAGRGARSAWRRTPAARSTARRSAT